MDETRAKEQRVDRHGRPMARIGDPDFGGRTVGGGSRGGEACGQDDSVRHVGDGSGIGGAKVAQDTDQPRGLSPNGRACLERYHRSLHSRLVDIQKGIEEFNLLIAQHVGEREKLTNELKQLEADLSFD